MRRHIQSQSSISTSRHVHQTRQHLCAHHQQHHRFTASAGRSIDVCGSMSQAQSPTVAAVLRLRQESTLQDDFWHRSRRRRWSGDSTSSTSRDAGRNVDSTTTSLMTSAGFTTFHFKCQCSNEQSIGYLVEVCRHIVDHVVNLLSMCAFDVRALDSMPDVTSHEWRLYGVWLWVYALSTNYSLLAD